MTDKAVHGWVVLDKEDMHYPPDQDFMVYSRRSRAEENARHWMSVFPKSAPFTVHRVRIEWDDE